MILEEDFESKAVLYAKAGIAYEQGKDYLISDEEYDALSKLLLDNYSHLPLWFTQKVTKSDLRTASASGFYKKFEWLL